MERVHDTAPGDATTPLPGAPHGGVAAPDLAAPATANPGSEEAAPPQSGLTESGLTESALTESALTESGVPASSLAESGSVTQDHGGSVTGSTVSSTGKSADPARDLAELRRAVRHGDEATCVRLLSQSPSLSTSESERGGTLLLEAHERELPGVAGLLLDARAAAGDGRLDVHEAASMGRPAELRRILTEDPLSFEEVGPAGFFPLHRSAYRGNLDATLLLLEMGADPRLPSRNAAGLTPLHSAIAGAARFGGSEHHRYQAVVEHLLAGGADPDAAMEGGWTPRTAADRDGSRQLLQLLGGQAPAEDPPPAGTAAGSSANSPATHT